MAGLNYVVKWSFGTKKCVLYNRDRYNRVSLYISFIGLPPGASGKSSKWEIMNNNAVLQYFCGKEWRAKNQSIDEIM